MRSSLVPKPSAVVEAGSSPSTYLPAGFNNDAGPKTQLSPAALRHRYSVMYQSDSPTNAATQSEIALKPPISQISNSSGGGLKDEVNVKAAIAHVRAGSWLKKYCHTRFVQPHDRFFSLDYDSLVLKWDSPKKKIHKTQIPLEQISAITEGEASDLAKRKVKTVDLALAIEIQTEERSLYVICPNAKEHALWIRGLTYARTKALARDHQLFKGANPIVKQLWSEACSSKTNTIHYLEFADLLLKLKINADRRYVRECFERHNEDGASGIDYHAFMEILDELIGLPELDECYALYSEGTESVTWEQLALFLKDVQQAGPTEIERVQSLIESDAFPAAFRSTETSEMAINYHGFCYLMAGKANTLLETSRLTEHMDMTRPLRSYWICSAYRSNLAANFSVEQVCDRIRNLLLSGYRFLHLELRIASNGTLEVVQKSRHRTGLETVLKCVMASAFERNPYPVFLFFSMEPSPSAKAQMAKTVNKIIGPSLVKMNDLTPLSSPADLKRKIVLVGPKTTTDAAMLSNFTDAFCSEDAITPAMNENEFGYVFPRGLLIPPFSPRHVDNKDDPRKLRSPKSLLRRNMEISDWNTPFEECIALDTKPFGCYSSLGSSQVGVIVSDALPQVFAYGTDTVIKHQSEFTIVVPPEADRVARDYDPTMAWGLGVQFACVPVCVQGQAALISRSKFQQNGTCGYLLKPASMLDEGSRTTRELALSVTLKVLRARQLPLPASTPDVRKRSSPVSVRFTLLAANPREMDVQQLAPAPLEGCAVQFGEPNNKVQFLVDQPSVAMIQIEVLLQDTTAEERLAVAALPVNLLRQGLRWCELRDNLFRTLPWCGLFMEVTIRTPSSPVGDRSSLRRSPSVSHGAMARAGSVAAHRSPSSVPRPALAGRGGDWSPSALNKAAHDKVGKRPQSAADQGSP